MSVARQRQGVSSKIVVACGGLFVLCGWYPRHFLGQATAFSHFQRLPTSTPVPTAIKAARFSAQEDGGPLPRAMAWLVDAARGPTSSLSKTKTPETNSTYHRRPRSIALAPLEELVAPKTDDSARLKYTNGTLVDPPAAVMEKVEEKGTTAAVENLETVTPIMTNAVAADDDNGKTDEWNASMVCRKAFDAVDQHPILLFDGACNLCNDWVNFCLDYDSESKFRFASLQSRVGQSILIRDGRSPDDRSDIVLATPQETYAKSDALLSVVSQLKGLPAVARVSATALRIGVPPWFRDAVYKFISANRHVLGDTDGPVCRLDLDGEYTGRFIEDPELE